MSKKYEMSDGTVIGICAAGLYAGNSVRKLLKQVCENQARAAGGVSGRLGREIAYAATGILYGGMTAHAIAKAYDFYKCVQKCGDSRRAQQNADTVVFTGEEEEEEYTDE